MQQRNYLIVGGSKGIGLGLVRRLVESGHAVTTLCRSEGELANVPGSSFVTFDALQDEVPLGAIPSTLHGFAFCPGSLNLRSFKSLKPETFRADFELNVVSAIRVLQGILPALKAGSQESQVPSSILFFSTVAVSQGLFAHASIAASKGAIEGLARTLASELAPDMRVNAIAPALTETSLTEKFFGSPEKIAALSEKYPLGRTGRVDDVASLGAYLLGVESSWITGQVIGVDGGMAAVRK